MKGVNSKDNKSDPYDNSTNNSVVTMNATAVTSRTQTSNSSDNAASSKNTQFPDNNQMPENPVSSRSMAALLRSTPMEMASTAMVIST